MLIGVSLGPGDRELLTLKALKAIKNADEVIVPGELAYNIVSAFRKPRLVKFPMGKSERVVEKLSDELADRCMREDVVFATLGDITFFSTFHDVAEKVREKNPNVEIEMIPGVPSFVSVFSKLKIFVNSPIKVVTQNEFNEEFVIVLKATKPKEVEKKLAKMGFKSIQVERLYMKGEKICKPEERASYFTMVIGIK